MRWLILLLLVACSVQENVHTPSNEEIIAEEKIIEEVAQVQYAEFRVTTLKLLEEDTGYWQYEYKNGDYIFIEKKRLNGEEFWQLSSAYFGEYDYSSRSDVQKSLDIIQLGNKELEEKQSMLQRLQ